MKERPILFSGPMVRAILSGQKMQTRRIAKNVRHPDLGNVYTPSALAREPQHVVDRCCPYGQPNDRLWVRETFMDLLGTGVEHRNADGIRQRYAFAAEFPRGSHADEVRKDYGLKWKPSIHMPRSASRITLEITGVRVELLQDISEADALAEGVDRTNTSIPGYATERYRRLWESINGLGSWDANPWVWVVEFKQIQP